MLTSTHTSVRLSSRTLSRSRSSTIAAPRFLATASRTFHTSYRRNEQQIPTTSSGSSSKSSHSNPSTSKASLSYVNILIASATILIGTPYALDLYSTLSGTAPSRSSSSSSSVPGKLEPYNHHPLPLATSHYYPDPSTASAHKLLQIALPTSTSPSSETDLKKKLRIRSIYIKEPSLVIERAYTPLFDTLPGSNASSLTSATKNEREVLDLIVKRYPDGELGRMLHRARPNPTVPQLEVRGPVDTWSFERDSANGGGGVPERIVMVVGGTGITPAFQLLTNLFGRPNAPIEATNIGMRMPRVDVLYATPDVENALLLPELYKIVEKNRDRVSVSLFAEHLPKNVKTLNGADQAALGQLTASTTGGSKRSWIPFFGKGSRGGVEAKFELTTATKGEVKIPVFESQITQQHLEKALSQQLAEEGKRTLVLVCGPDGMVDVVAGPKSRDGQTQGQLGGLLKKIGLRQIDVFKL